MSKINKPKIGEVYKHFKHDPDGEKNNHVYEIVSISRNTETKEVLVVYKHLYDLDYLNEKGCDTAARPLEMFMDHVERENYKGPRFIKIDDITNL